MLGTTFPLWVSQHTLNRRQLIPVIDDLAIQTGHGDRNTFFYLVYGNGEKVLIQYREVCVLSRFQGSDRILRQHIFGSPGGRHLQGSVPPFLMNSARGLSG